MISDLVISNLKQTPILDFRRFVVNNFSNETIFFFINNLILKDAKLKDHILSFEKNKQILLKIENFL